MKKALISDLDGTIALLRGRNPYSPKTIMKDELNEPIANLLHVYKNQKLFDVSIFIITGRYERYRKETIRWLKKNDMNIYDELYMRGNDDRRKDFVLKEEIYRKHIENKFDVLFVLEDRDQAVQMWRDKLDLTCLQVAPGSF